MTTTDKYPSPGEAHAAGTTAFGALDQALVRLVDQVSAILRQESDHIVEPRSAAFQAIVDRKSHLALELGILLQGVSAPMLGREAKSKLDRFSAELNANARLLDRHIGAVRELSTIIAREIETAGADGTYSPTIATRRGAA